MVAVSSAALASYFFARDSARAPMGNLLVRVCGPGFDLPKYTRGRNPAYNRVGETGTSYAPEGGEHVAKGHNMKKEKKKPKKEKK
jgi:hypothetical protein